MERTVKKFNNGCRRPGRISVLVRFNIIFLLCIGWKREVKSLIIEFKRKLYSEIALALQISVNNTGSHPGSPGIYRDFGNRSAYFFQ